MTRKADPLIITSISVARKKGRSAPDPTPLRPSGVYEHHRSERETAPIPVAAGMLRGPAKKKGSP